MSTPRQRLPGELVFNVLLVLLSLGLLWQAYAISRFESISSAGSFPMFAAALMLICALVSLVQARRSRATPALAGETRISQFMRQVAPLQWIGLTLALVGYMLLLDRAGFLLASYFFLALSMRLLGSRRWGLNLLISAVSLGAVYAVFQLAFSVVLPKGRWLAGWLS